MMNQEHQAELDKVGLTQGQIDAIAITFAHYAWTGADSLRDDFINLSTKALEDGHIPKLRGMIAAQFWLPLSLSTERDALTKAAFVIRGLYETAKTRFHESSLEGLDPALSISIAVMHQARKLDVRLKGSRSIISGDDLLAYKAIQALNHMAGMNSQVAKIYDDLRDTLIERGVRLSDEEKIPTQEPLSDSSMFATKGVLIDYVMKNHASLRSDILAEDFETRRAAVRKIQDVAGAIEWPAFAPTHRAADFVEILPKVKELKELATTELAEKYFMNFIASDPWAGISAIVAQHGLAACAEVVPSVDAPLSHKQTAAAVRGLHGRPNADPRLQAAYAAVEALMPKEVFSSAPKAKAAKAPAP